MATQIIVTETPTIGGDMVVKGLFWFYPPVANQQYYKKPLVVSQFVRASAQNNTDIQAGVIVEESFEYLVPVGWTVPQVKADLIAKYNSRQSVLGAELSKFSNTGLSYDGSVWSTL